MQHRFAFKLSVLAASLLVTNALLGCGDVDPGINMPPAGAAGDANSGGDGTGGSEGAAGMPGVVPEGALLPWVTGNTWSYRVTNAGVVSEKTTTVGELQEVGGMGPNAGLMAFHVVTAKGVDGTDRTESWQAPHPDAPERIVRYREQSFGAVTGVLEQEEHWDPEKLHIDGSADRTVTGATWLERYDETSLRGTRRNAAPRRNRSGLRSARRWRRNRESGGCGGHLPRSAGSARPRAAGLPAARRR
jgi:hypothetical protein